MPEHKHTVCFEKIIFEDEKQVLVYDDLNDRDCWLPKYYKDGRALIHVEESKNGVEITIPEWLAIERELV